MTIRRIGQPRYAHPRKRQIVRGCGIKHAVHKDQPHRIQSAKQGCIVINRQCGRQSHGCIQRRRVGVLPIFIALAGQAHARQPRHSRLAWRSQPAGPRQPRQALHQRLGLD